MKKRHLTTALAFLAVSLSAFRCLSFPYALESRSADTNATKFGFSEFTSSCSGDPTYSQKIYMKFDWQSMDQYTVAGGPTEVIEEWEVQTYDTNGVWERMWYQSQKVDGDLKYWQTNYQYESESESVFEYDDGGTYWNHYAVFPSGICTEPIDEDSGGGTEPIYSWSTNYCTNVISGGYYTYSSSLEQNLSEEFTTETLIAKKPGPYTSEWITTADGKTSQGAASYIYDHTDVGENEYWRNYSADTTWVTNRIWAVAPKGERFKIPYIIYTLVEGETEAVPESGEFGGTGTGYPTYYEFLELKPKATSVVNQLGCPDYSGVSQWIVLGCGYLEGGGGGGGCDVCQQGEGSFDVSSGEFGFLTQLNLGADAYGDASGQLIAASPTPSDDLATPASLSYIGALEDVDQILVGGALRQVKHLNGLVDIVTITDGYEMRYYTNYGTFNQGTGLYNLSGNVYTTGRIEEVGSTNHIRVTVINSATNVFDYVWSDADQGWTLTSGGGLRKEQTVWDTNNLIRTSIIRNYSDDVVLEEEKHYLDLSGEGLVIKKKVVDPDGVALTSQWFYYDDQMADGTNYGKLKLQIEPTGFWTGYEYNTNGLVTKEISQFLNAATNAADSSCRVVEYDYTPIDGARAERRIEKLLDQEISRTYTIYYLTNVHTIQCQEAGADWDDADNLVTITAYNSDGKVWRTINPDGTVNLYLSDTNTGPRIDVSLSGEPGDGYYTNVVAGSSNVTSTTLSGQVSYQKQYDVSDSILQVGGVSYQYDNVSRRTRADYLDGTFEAYVYACCGVESMTNHDGSVTGYVYDGLNRQNGIERNSVITGRDLDAVGNALREWRIPTSGPEMTLSTMGYDVAGRLIAQTNGLSGVTLTTNVFDGSGQMVVTNTYPDGGTRIETYYQDGSLRSVTGTAAFPVYYEYGVENDGTGVTNAYSREIKGSPTGNEWTKTYSDMLGRSCKTVYAAASGSPASVSYYNDKGQLEKQVDPDGNTTWYEYNDEGELDYTVVDVDQDDVKDLGGPDRVTHTESDVFTLQPGQLWYSAGMSYPNVQRTRTWQTNDSNQGVLVSHRWASVDGTRSASIAFGLTNQTVTTQGSGTRTVTSIAPDGTSTVSVYNDGQLASVTQKDASASQLSQTTYGYDAHGRQYQMTDARNGTTTYGYHDNADLVETVTTPDPDGGGSGATQITTTYYDTRLRATNVVHADSTSTYSEYFENGLLKKTWGSRTYPVEYAYDYAGRMTNMITWQEFNQGTGVGISGDAANTWIYDQYRGWLSSKEYDDGNGPSYEYTAAGRLETRTWARGIETTYGYNGAGDLASVAYDDGVTPAAGYGYDRLGRQTTVTNGGTLWITREYNDAGRLLSEGYNAGPLNGISVTNGYDTYLRRTKLALLSGSTVLKSTDYTYDGDSGRLDTVSDGTHTAEYDYLANSALVSQITFKESTTTRMTTTKSYDFLNRLTNIVSSAGGSNVASFAYLYNPVNQRTSVTNADGSYWVYTYDDLGQVTSGKKRWSDGTLVAGQQFEYGFDDIGNREQTKAGGDANGANLREAGYTANSLNQYTARTVPGYAGVSGTASTNATVTVNLNPTIRQVEYWWGETLADNSSAPVWLTLTNVGVISNATSADIVTSITGNVYVAKSPEAFYYDLDGNMTGDSVWTNIWNAENRRTLTESTAGIASDGKRRVAWTYLSDGRWIERIVSTNNGSGYFPAFTNRYVWDDKVLLAVLDGDNDVLLSFTRGLDLSGTLQGAGGVGGLLWVDADTEGTHFAAFDGNGNVTGLVDAADGSESARYEYGPFAEDIRATGPMAEINPMRFSTQYADDVTGDRKYLYRDYRADIGRWPSRDPIGEEGGIQLYGVVENNMVTTVDVLGLWELRCRSLNGIAKVTCQKHCWVECDGKSYSLLNDAGTANKIIDDPRDKGKGEIVASGPGSCECIQKQFEGNKHSYEYRALSCNSNYHAHKLLSCCSIKVKQPRGAAGWNDCTRAVGIFLCKH